MQGHIAEARAACGTFNVQFVSAPSAPPYLLFRSQPKMPGRRLGFFPGGMWVSTNLQTGRKLHRHNSQNRAVQRFVLASNKNGKLSAAWALLLAGRTSSSQRMCRFFAAVVPENFHRSVCTTSVHIADHTSDGHPRPTRKTVSIEGRRPRMHGMSPSRSFQSGV